MSDQSLVDRWTQLSNDNAQLRAENARLKDQFESIRTVLNDQAEYMRRRNHHEAFCLVLGKAFDRPGAFALSSDFENIVQQARVAANLAYPPPKSGDGWCRCNASPEPHIHQLVPDEPPKAPPWPSMDDVK